VAVKIMGSVHEIVEEIEVEFLVLRDLSSHPNMPKFHGLYLERRLKYDDQLWIAMEVLYLSHSLR